MAKAMKEKETEIIIQEVTVGRVSVWLRGATPLIYHAMSQKVRQGLLLPPPKLTGKKKPSGLKHDPLQEYRESVYARRIQEDGPTRLTLPCCYVKAAMRNAALEVPETSKAQVGRLIWVNGNCLDMYGVPQMLMSVVKNSGQNQTPDIRTRAILPQWACKVTLDFVQPQLTEVAVMNLLGLAGLLIGLGDFRPEKGRGNYGQFTVCNEGDVSEIVRDGGRTAQDKALENPAYYDTETEELYTWFEQERARLGR